MGSSLIRSYASHSFTLGTLPGYTSRYWDYYQQRFERDRGLKIDFVLGSAPFAERVTGALIDREERDPTVYAGAPSDHAPVVVDLAD